MRKIYFLLLIFLIGCKSKSISVEKSEEKQSAALARHFDSILKQSIKMQLDWQKSQSLISNSLRLKSIPVLDSLGKRIPFHYKRFIDGQLQEEIWLEGGEVINETSSSVSTEAETKDETKAEETKIKVEAGQKAEVKKKTKKKGKKVEVQGFQFGFYLWLLLVVIIIIILRWIAKRFKLFKENKKPSDI